ncbi:MAG: N-acyl homoserine lactonase family protein [Bacteroidota bacterium]
MNRRHFLNALAHLGGSLYLNPSFMNPLIDPWPSRSYHCANGIRIHALATGSVRVKKTHRQPSALGMAAILFDPRWTNALPVHCWLIEHPEGLILIDTGESARFHEKDHLACDPGAGWVNQSILRFELSREQEIDQQLSRLGFCAEDVRWVVLTHLHIDHVDGLPYFPQAEILVSQTEYQNPYGAVLCHLPSWFKPRLIRAERSHPHFAGAYYITAAEDVLLVPTPGHSYGHQSVILRSPQLDFCFAGDASFSEEQLRQEKVAGICADKKAARQSYTQLKAYCRERPVVYLPSHDPQSAERLASGTVYT